MIKVLFAGPITGKTGGIAVWSQKFIRLFPDTEFQLVPIDLTTKMTNVSNPSPLYRIRKGLSRFWELRKDAINAIRQNPDIRIMHTTTSGSFGTVRDLMMVNLCHKHNIKCIMHCRYGCIPEDFNSKGFLGWLLRKTMYKYDQVWVLDTRSEQSLKKDPIMRNKVFLTPNSIDVPQDCDFTPKSYTKIAYLAHLVPTKGLYELVSAVKKLNGRVDLLLIGPGPDDIVNQVKTMAGDIFDKHIFLLGKKDNAEAIKLLKSVDIMALPTYYPWEGFPISIIEAMSYGKLVISCPRAAISDMLTAVDGSQCGILVEPKSDDAIKEGIEWCLLHKKEADEMCRKAYEKVLKCYDTSVIYELYRQLYRKLL